MEVRRRGPDDPLTASTPRRSARRWSWRRERGLAGLAFADAGEEKATLADMRRRWPKATYVGGRRRAPRRSRAASSIRAVAGGAAAAHRADRHRLRGAGLGGAARRFRWAGVATYSDIASKIGTPKAARAVGAAVGKNPIVVRGAVPPRARQIRRHHRLSLGPHPQARDARLGGRAGRAAA